MNVLQFPIQQRISDQQLLDAVKNLINFRNTLVNTYQYAHIIDSLDIALDQLEALKQLEPYLVEPYFLEGSDDN